MCSPRPGRFLCAGIGFLLNRASAAAYSFIQPLNEGEFALVKPGRHGSRSVAAFLFSGSDQARRQMTYPSPPVLTIMAPDVPRGRAMGWLVLQCVYMPHLFRLHSETKWLAMDRHERQGWEIIKRCGTREEASVALNEARAAAEKGRTAEGSKGRLAFS
jgi:hypothetical protein